MHLVDASGAVSRSIEGVHLGRVVAGRSGWRTSRRRAAVAGSSSRTRTAATLGRCGRTTCRKAGTGPSSGCPRTRSPCTTGSRPPRRTRSGSSPWTVAPGVWSSTPPISTFPRHAAARPCSCTPSPRPRRPARAARRPHRGEEDAPVHGGPGLVTGRGLHSRRVERDRAGAARRDGPEDDQHGDSLLLPRLVTRRHPDRLRELARVPEYTGRGGTPTRYDVYSVAVDGSDLRRLTSVNGDDLFDGGASSEPTWWPDGSRLFIGSGRIRSRDEQ